MMSVSLPQPADRFGVRARGWIRLGKVDGWRRAGGSHRRSPTPDASGVLMSVPIRTVALGAAIALTVPLLGITAADAHATHADGHHADPLAARSALGDDPKNRNGQGPLKVKLTNTANGKIKVHWKGKGPRKNFKPWKIVTSISRDMTIDRKVYHAKGKKRSKVVKHAVGVTPASGDYTFVKIYAKRKHGLKGGSSPTHWIQAPVTAVPTGNDRLVVGTFNVRNANLDPSGSYTWDNRKGNVFRNITSSGAGIVNLQEASGQNGNDLFQMREIAQGTGYDLVNSGYYRNGGAITGEQGTRILYDAARYQVVASGAQLLSTDGGVSAPWAAWAEFRENATGRLFYDISIHLTTGKARAAEKLRSQQTGEVIGLAKHLTAAHGNHEVFVAGDSNSTTNNKPRPMVHPQFVKAGFYDAFATRSITGQAYPTTNNFEFPVKPGPFRRDLILTYNGPRGSFWYHNQWYNSASQAASDHFMQSAELPLG
jgi:endonuclease/exonuclease/phosphatase family metal-dependent hydrolase